MEYVHLVGAEQVQSAANTMRSAAEEMQRAASSQSYALEAHQRFMDDWLRRLEVIVDRLEADAKDKQIAALTAERDEAVRAAMIGTETLRQMRRAEALEAELARLKSPLPRYRHKKRGTEYVLIGFGRMQSGNWIGDVMVNGEYTRKTVDMHEVAIYRSVDDGSLWVRPREEFEDGRFELITEAVT